MPKHVNYELFSFHVFLRLLESLLKKPRIKIKCGTHFSHFGVPDLLLDFTDIWAWFADCIIHNFFVKTKSIKACPEISSGQSRLMKLCVWYCSWDIFRRGCYQIALFVVAESFCLSLQLARRLLRRIRIFSVAFHAFFALPSANQIRRAIRNARRASSCRSLSSWRNLHVKHK